MKISIITICYNSGKYLERAIDSVLVQDYKNWEHIVIDGGSKDKTLNILKKHKHLKWVSEPDKGQSDAMNKGFERSTGDIIIYLNADDELSPGLFSVVHSHYQNNPATDLLVMDLLSINSGKKTISKPSTSLLEILRFEPCRFPLNPVSYAYRRSLQLKAGAFPVDNHFAMDYWFLLRAYLFGNVRYEPFVGGVFYFDGNNKSADWNNSRKHLKEVRDNFLKDYYYTKPVIKFSTKLLRTELHYVWLSCKRLLPVQ